MFSTVKKVYIPNTNTLAYYECVLTDGSKMGVPLDAANTDYQEIQDWIADGNSVVDPNAE